MDSLETIRKTNFTRVAYLASCFTILFIAYSSAQNLVSQLYKQLGFDRLGQLCIFTVYIFLAVTNSITSHYKKKITTKFGLVGGTVAYVSFIFAGTLTTYCGKYSPDTFLCDDSMIYFLNVFTCALLGFGAAFLWICQSIYVNDCADDQTRGAINGTFWSIFQSNMVISSALATFVLGSTDQYTFYLILSVFGLISVIMFVFVKPPASFTKEAPKQEESSETLGEALKSFFTTLGTQKYFFLYLGMLVSGINIAFYANFLATVVENTVQTSNINELNQSIGCALIALAVGEVLAGLQVGRLADRYNKLNVFNWTIVVSEAALMVTLLAFLFDSYKFSIICGFLWGFGDTAVQTMINAVIGSFFGGNVQLFSAYRFIQGFGVTFGSALAIFVPRDAPLIYVVGTGIALAIVHVLFIKNLPKSDRKSQEPLLDEKNLMYEMKNV